MLPIAYQTQATKWFTRTWAAWLAMNWRAWQMDIWVRDWESFASVRAVNLQTSFAMLYQLCCLTGTHKMPRCDKYEHFQNANQDKWCFRPQNSAIENEDKLAYIDAMWASLYTQRQTDYTCPTRLRLNLALIRPSLWICSTKSFIRPRACIPGPNAKQPAFNYPTWMATLNVSWWSNISISICQYVSMGNCLIYTVLYEYTRTYTRNSYRKWCC